VQKGLPSIYRRAFGSLRRDLGVCRHTRTADPARPCRLHPCCQGHGRSYLKAEVTLQFQSMEVAPFGVKICTPEPGGIRTNWARRAGQNAPDLLPDYEVSVGSMLKIPKSGRSARCSRHHCALTLSADQGSSPALPELPGIQAGRTNTRRSAAKRQRPLSKYRRLLSTMHDENRPYH
jgi:hypothetical protein